MSGFVLNQITAHEARQLSEDVGSVDLNYVYTTIRTAAEKGETSVLIDGKLKKPDETKLKGLGYSITTLWKDCTTVSTEVIIDWSKDLSDNYYSR